MEKIQYQLLGTSGSLDGMIKMLTDFWYRKDIQLHTENNKQWTIILGGVEMLSCRVTKKGKRYRFESEQ